jgi:hypothetical protein
MGLDKSPDRYAGSGASMGGIGSGAYGLLNSLFMAEGGLAKKQNWFQRYVSNLTKSSDSLPAWARDPLGSQALLRKLAGQGRKGDSLSAAMLPLNFMGAGLGSKLGMPIKGLSSGAQLATKAPSVISKFTPEMKSFEMADIDAKAYNALKNMDPSSIKIPETGISFSPRAAKGAIREWIQEGFPSDASSWEIVQALRETLLKNKYPKVDLSDVAKFNEYYAKEFYGLLPDDSIKLFKGVSQTTNIGGANGSKAWRTGERDLGTYFSTNPYIASVYAAMLGSARVGGDELPMFSINKKISELKNFLGEGSIRNSNAQGSMEFPQVLGGEDLSKMLPSLYSLPGQVYGKLFGATSNNLKSIPNQWPFGFAGGGLVSGLLSKAKSLAYKPINFLNQYINYFKARGMVKKGMFHGSADLGRNSDGPFNGITELGKDYSRDPYYGMGFYGTTSKAEADLYAGGYNAPGQWGESYGSLNKITKIPFGRYLDFSKNLKKQNYGLWSILGKQGFMGAGENLGSLMNKSGMTGSIMPRISAGMAPGDINAAKWIALNKPEGTKLTSNFANGGMVKYKLPSYDVGSPYIPKDQIAQLHKGERVLTAEQNKNFSSSGPVTNNITINGADKDPKQIAQEVMIQLERIQSKNNKTNLVGA